MALVITLRTRGSPPIGIDTLANTFIGTNILMTRTGTVITVLGIERDQSKPTITEIVQGSGSLRFLSKETICG